MLDDLQDKMAEPEALKPEEVTALRRLLARLKPPEPAPKLNGQTPFDHRIAATQLELDEAQAAYDIRHNAHYDALRAQRVAVRKGRSPDDASIRELREEKDRAELIVRRARSRLHALEATRQRWRVERW